MAPTSNVLRNAATLLLALIAALFFLSAYSPPHDHAAVETHHTDRHSTAATAAVSHLADSTAIDAQALADMHVFAYLQLGDFAELPHTFGSTPHYAHNWHLAWVDVVQHGHVTRIYHLTNKHDHQERFVAACDTGSGATSHWQELY